VQTWNRSEDGNALLVDHQGRPEPPLLALRRVQVELLSPEMSCGTYFRRAGNLAPLCPPFMT